MLSIALSYLGGARICDLRVIYRPIKKKVMFSCALWNVIDAINETHNFSFPLDCRSLQNIEAELGPKIDVNDFEFFERAISEKK